MKTCGHGLLVKMLQLAVFISWGSLSSFWTHLANSANAEPRAKVSAHQAVVVCLTLVSHCRVLLSAPAVHIFALRLQCVLQPLCSCLSSDGGLPTASQCVSVLTSICSHHALAQQLCSQHGKTPRLASLQCWVTWPLEIHWTGDSPRLVSIQPHSSSGFGSFDSHCHFFRRSVCFSQVVQLHQNQNGRPVNAQRLDPAGPAGDALAVDPNELLF